MRGGSLTRYDPYQGLGGQRGVGGQQSGGQQSGGQRGGSAAWKFAGPILKQAAKAAALSYLERIKGGTKRKSPSEQGAATGAKQSKRDIFGT